MNEAIMAMIRRADPKTLGDHDRVLREIMQQICLLGLWRARFFEHAAFYGGTALRLLYGLDRFSEDLDFSLLKPDPEFTLEPYFDFIRRELNAFDFETEIETKNSSAIESAFIRADTKIHVIKIGAGSSISDSIPHGQVMKVKFEVDTDPPPSFETESKFILEPVPFGVRAYTPGDLFAGKMHAILFRSWKNRVKGRDWYDLVFFVRNGTPLHLEHLAARMRQTGHLLPNESLTADTFASLLNEKIDSIDFTKAREDAAPFIKDPSALEIWSQNFFREMARRIPLA